MQKQTQKLTLRLPKSLHEQLKKLASEEGVTLNQLCLYLLSLGIGKKDKEKSQSL